MKHKKTLTRAEKAIMFVERYCKIPEGMHVGKPLLLSKFQKKFYIKLFDNPHGTRKAIWSMGRKNAKTVTMATLLLVFLVGPEAQLNAQIESGAMSRDQAAKVFEYCCKIIRLSPELSSLIRIIPSKKILIGLLMNTTYTALSADAKTAQGGSPLVVICDELGQVVGPRSDFFDALITSQGAHENPLLIVISTQAASDTDLLSIMIDDALKEADPHTIVELHTAPEGCDVMDESAWYAANPALGQFLSLESVRLAAQEAKRMPSAEARFRNLILNQRVDRHNPFVARTSWQACGGDVDVKPEDCEELYGGLDMSKRTDLTAFVLIGLKDGIWYVWCWFWTPENGLVERARRDRSPYDVWHSQGFLITTPGSTVDYEWAAFEMAEICRNLDVTAIAFDRYRMDVLKKELDRIGVDLPMTEWGQGFISMAPALDSLEAKILNTTLRHGNHPVLTMCAAHSVVTTDPAGNRKLDKSKTSGRIDGMVALAMAAGVAEKHHDQEGKLEKFISEPLIL